MENKTCSNCCHWDSSTSSVNKYTNLKSGICIIASYMALGIYKLCDENRTCDCYNPRQNKEHDNGKQNMRQL